MEITSKSEEKCGNFLFFVEVHKAGDAQYLSLPRAYVWLSAPLKQLTISEVESRTQGSRPRPRTQKKSEAKAKDSLSEDRHSRGQGQECSRPRTKDTSASALQKKKKKKGLHKNFSGDLQKKKKVFTKIFQAISTKTRFPKNFSSAPQNIQKLVLSSSRGQASFRGLEASRPRPRTSKCVLEDSTSERYIYCHSILIYTVGSLQAKCIVKMSRIFLPLLHHKDFFGWVTSLHGEKNVSNFFQFL